VFCPVLFGYRVQWWGAFRRVRHGSVHVVNNVYDGWGIYAIGGSEGPTIVSEGNIFSAPNTRDKEVLLRITPPPMSCILRNLCSWLLFQRALWKLSDLF
jgi:hypothetical protein